MSRIIVARYWEETEPPWDNGHVPWIVRIMVRWAITIIGFLAAEWFVNWVYSPPDRFVLDGAKAVLIASAIYVVLRGVLRPILLFLTCPLQLITLGLFIFVVNALIVLATREVCDWFNVAFTVDGFFPALIGAFVISGVSFALSRILRRNPFTTRLR